MAQTNWHSDRYQALEDLGWDMTRDIVEPEPVGPLETINKDDFRYPVVVNEDRTGIIEVESGFRDLDDWR
jgi:hypothetical protein